MPSIYLPVITSEDRSPSVLVDVTTKSSSTSTSHPVVVDGRFTKALWELLYLVVSGLTLFSLVYFCFFSSSSSSTSSQQQRSLSYVKSDHSIVPTILVPPRPGLLIESMCVHESGSVLCTSYSNGSVCLWNPQTGGLVFHHQRLSSSHVWCSVMLDEYRCLLGSSTGEVELFSSDTRTTKPFIFVNEHLGGITDLLRVSSSMIIGITRRGYFLALEDLNTALREIYIKRIHQWPIRVCRFDWNSSLIFTGSDDHSIKVTNLSNGLCLHTLHKHQSPVNCLALDPVRIFFFFLIILR